MLHKFWVIALPYFSDNLILLKLVKYLFLQINYLNIILPKRSVPSWTDDVCAKHPKKLIFRPVGYDQILDKFISFRKKKKSPFKASFLVF